jgi:hypothetical protein
MLTSAVMGLRNDDRILYTKAIDTENSFHMENTAYKKSHQTTDKKPTNE